MNSQNDHTPDDAPVGGDAPRLPSAAPAAPTLPDAGPFLPDAPPTVAGAAPFLPDAPRPVAEPAPEPEFDAKAMVESQKHYNPNPVYGAMPSGSEQGREAARKLREEANRKRKRGKVIGRIFGVVFLAAAGVVGYFVYRAIQDANSDDVDVATDAGADPAGPSLSDSAGGAITPAGNLDEALAASDALNQVAVAGAGGYLDAIDDARDVVADINGDTPADASADTPTDGGSSAAPIVAPTVIEAAVTRLDLGGTDGSIVEQIVSDRTDDTYLIATADASQLFRVVQTDPTSFSRYATEGDILERAPRDERSLDPAPDGLFVSPIVPELVVPDAVMAHASPTIFPLVNLAGEQAIDTAYVVDVDGLRADDPAAADTFVGLLRYADPGTLPAVDMSAIERVDVTDDLAAVASDAVSGLAWPTVVDFSAAPVPAQGEMIVAWRLAASGLIDRLYVAAGDGSVHWMYEVKTFDGTRAPTFLP